MDKYQFGKWAWKFGFICPFLWEDLMREFDGKEELICVIWLNAKEK